MLTRFLLLALLSALATLFYLRVGYHVLRLAPRARANQIFFLTCLTFGCWALGCTLLPSAPEDHVWLWLKVSSPGWTLAPSLVLHFLLLLAGRDEVLKKRWVLAAIYAPGLFFFTQALLGPEQIGVERFVQSPWGWAGAHSALTPPKALYLLYATGFVCCGLWLVHLWGRRSKLISRRRQAAFVVFPGLLALPLAFLSGVLRPWAEFTAIPDVAHLIVGLWILSIRYAISRYRLMDLTPAVVAQDILRTIQDVVFLLDQKRSVVQANLAGEELFGIAEADLVGRPIQSVLGGPESQAATAILGLLDSEGSSHVEIAVQGGEGQLTPMSASFSQVCDEHGQEIGTVLILRDITRQKSVEDKLRFTASHDPLTQLPNRTILDDRLQQAISRAERRQRSFALLLLDIDNFKDVNDSLGHPAGDAVLKEIARRLQHCVRGIDTVCRLAGDEFLIVLEDLADPTDVEAVVERTLTSIGRPIEIDEHSLLSGACIGISVFPTDGETGEELLKRADLALYSCKRRGRGLWEFFAPEMDEANRRRIAIERGLQRALENDEIFLLYQPMVDLSYRRVVGIEALARWQSPELGLMGPDEFIPIAERTGLIVPIGEWVLRTACRQSRAWQAGGARALPVSVNVSVKQLQRDDFVEVVAEALAESGLEPSLLEVELTESIAVGNIEQCERTVAALGELGVRIVIDDFGTGHSSLSRLRQLQMHAVKIDRTFMKNIEAAGKDRDLVTTIIAMAHKLNVDVIAEGVETEEQLDALRAISGANAADSELHRLQGFLFSRPVSAEAILRKLLETERPDGDEVDAADVPSIVA